MPIVLFTDFGAADLYVGQVKAVLTAHAPRIPVIDALHDAPSFDILASAHLLAALAPRTGRHPTVLAVIDPGVGTARDAIVVDADGRTYVGPDNGLLSIVWQRARRRRCRVIRWQPAGLSVSFHGRDLFARVAAALATRRVPARWLASSPAPRMLFDPQDLAEVIYVDHYGNAMTGLRAAGIKESNGLRIGRRRVPPAKVFGAAQRGRAFWYANSLGLVEIAVPQASAAAALDLRVGTRVVVR